MDTGDHVYQQLSGSFPPAAISWVKDSAWYGPVTVPFSAIDDDDISSWAAWKEPEVIASFARGIAAGTGHTDPSILIKGADARFIIIDGHHRALARERLGLLILAYVGTVPPSLVRTALQTHDSQFSTTTAADDNARKCALGWTTSYDSRIREMGWAVLARG